MATPLTIPTAAELQQFYPISESIDDDKREQLKNYVENHMFLKMFGYEAMTNIMSGDIPDSSSVSFIGFQKFLALCCAYAHERDPLISTNLGARIPVRGNVKNPSNEEKRITLQDIEDTISVHLRQAMKVLGDSKCAGTLPSWGGYFSYKISRL